MATGALAGRTGLIVDPPQILPLGFGLLSVAQMPPVTETDQHWMMGVQFEEMGSAVAQIMQGGITTPLTTERMLDVQYGQASAVAVQVVVDVSAVGRDPQMARQRAAQFLDAAAPNVLETAIWTGITQDGSPVTPSLATSTKISSDPVPLAAGVGILEEWLADRYNGVGVIHAPRRLNAAMQRDLLVTTVAGHKETGLGTRVAFGVGYLPTDPTAGGDVPGGPLEDVPTWLCISPAVMVRQSEDVIAPDVQHSFATGSNRVVVAAQRQYLVAWEGQTAAIEVTA